MRSAELSDAGGGPAAHPDARRSALIAFIGDSAGATSIEYAMIAAGISVAIITALGTLSINVKALFDAIVAAL